MELLYSKAIPHQGERMITYISNLEDEDGVEEGEGESENEGEDDKYL